MSEENSPLEEVDSNSVTLLFDRDSSVVPDVDLDVMIDELRRRANVEAARLAAEAAEPKARPKKKGSKGELVDLALASLADKPTDELSLDDLLGEGDAV